MYYDALNPDSKMFPNQAIMGRDQELYAKDEKEVPRRYHEKLKEYNKQNIYPELYPEGEDKTQDVEGCTTVIPPKAKECDESEEEVAKASVSASYTEPVE